MDAECKCIGGYELLPSNIVATCIKCDNYEYNQELGGTCTNCPAGQQGSGINGQESVSCEPCPINFYKDDEMTKCEYCLAGTNSQRGTTTCHVCDPGKKITIADQWSGFVWDYKHTPPEWVSYTGSTNIPRTLDVHRFYESDDANTAQTEIYWLDTCDGTCLIKNEKTDGMQRFVQQPEYPMICVSCVVGEIFIR
jgi:hypothetical protein